MKRGELEALSLDELYRLAAERGIREAAGLPRDTLLERLAAGPGAAGARGEGREAGRARDEQAAAPEAGARARDSGPHPRGAAGNRRHPAGIPSSVAPDRPQEHDTETMARLYLEQGDAEHAVELYRELLLLRPGDESLHAALAAAEHVLGRGAAPVAAPATEPPPPPPRPPSEPLGMLDLAEPPEAYGVDECEVMFKDPHYLFVYWEVTDAGLAAARRDLGEKAGEASLVIRLFAHVDRPERGGGPEREFRDYPLDWNHGRRYFPSPRPGARVRAAVALLTPSGLFAPIAHSSQVRVPHGEPAGTFGTEWMEVAPARSRGATFEPVALPDRRITTSERSPAAPIDGAGTPPSGGAGAAPPGGGSERNLPPGGSPHGAAAMAPAPSSPSSPWRWRPGSQR